MGHKTGIFKRICSLLLILCMCAALIPALVFAEDSVGQEQVPASAEIAGSREAEQRVTFDKTIPDSGIRVQVSAEQGAFPEGTSMQVRQIADAADKTAVVEKIADVTGETAVQYTAVDIAFFDRSGNEIEPAAPVQVSIQAGFVTARETPVVVHIDDNGEAEQLEVVAQQSKSVTVEADSFSVYAVAYTVEFHFGNDTWTIEGGSSTMLSEILSALGLAIPPECISSVSFSDERLVSVTRDGLDWKLTSLAPFKSNERLTVTLVDGTRGQIAIADGETDAAGETTADGNQVTAGGTSADGKTAADGGTSDAGRTGGGGETSADRQTTAGGKTSADGKTAAGGKTSDDGAGSGRGHASAGSSERSAGSTDESRQEKGFTYVIDVTDGQDVSTMMNAVITSTSSTYLNNTEANFTISYSPAYGSISEDDYMILSVSGPLKNILPAASSQHFKNVIDMGNGQYRLVFGPNAPTIVSGTIELFTITNNTGETDQTASVQIGDAAREVIVKGSPQGSGTVEEDVNRIIYKDGPYAGQYGPSDKNMYGYYDVKGEAQSIMFRISVDEKHVNMNDTVVTDTLPDGMVFDPDSVTIQWAHNTSSSVQTSELSDAEMDKVSVTQNGQQVIFRLNDLLAEIEREPAGSHHYILIYYYAEIPANTKVAYVNNARLETTCDNVAVTDSTNYTVKPRTGGAGSNEWKTVDKTAVSGDNQLVTYKLYIWVDNRAAAGSIVTHDQLDTHVKYISSSLTPYLDVTCDENNQVTIKNPIDIPQSTLLEVTLTVSFEDVPAGYAVKNVFGDTETITYKDVECRLEGTKTVNGEVPDGVTFQFDLLDETGAIAATTRSDAQGRILFEGLSFSADDVGKTFSYTVRENAESAERYDVTPEQYEVEITPQIAANGTETRLEAVPVFKVSGAAADSMTFDNTPVKTSIALTKVWEDDDDAAGVRPDEITVQLLADGKAYGDPVIIKKDSKIEADGETYADSWSYLWSDVPKYNEEGEEIVYSFREAEIGIYTPSVKEDGGVPKTISDKSFTITNRLNTTDISGEKIWADEDFTGKPGYTRPESISVRLYRKDTATGAETADGDPVVVRPDADGKWTYQFTDLPDLQNITYIVKEETVSGYTASYDAEHVNITNTPVDQNETITPVSLTIRKTDPDGSLLADAEFTLTAADDTVQTYTTGVDGTAAITFSEAGSWTLQETKAPDGYTINPQKYTITVKKSGVIKVTYDAEKAVWNRLYNLFFDPEFEENTLTVTDELKPSEPEPSKPEPEPSTPEIVMNLRKIGEDNNPLKGAEFTLLDSAGKQLASWTSDGTTWAFGAYLSCGKTYLLRETKAPDGYKAAKDMTLVVAEDGTVTVGGQEANLITVKDVRKTSPGSSKTTVTKKPSGGTNTSSSGSNSGTGNKTSSGTSAGAAKTGDTTPVGALAAVLIAAAAALVILLFVRRKRRNH